jgi:acetyl esterase/lipase
VKRILVIVAATFMAVALGLWLGGGRWLLVQIAHRMAEPAAVVPPPDIEVERDIVFAQTADGPLALDIYTPWDRPAGGLPVVVFVFGGGWFAGNKNQLQLLDGHLLAREGYAVVATSYRRTDLATFPAQIHDVKATIRWVRAHADEYGFDPNAIGAWGGSAGGHLVALLATTNGNAELEGDTGGEALRGHSSDVQAVVDFFGPTHLPRLRGSAPGIEWMVEGLLGGPIAERLTLAELASPELHVSPETAPLLIVHGAEDPTVPLGQSTGFQARLQQAGADSTLRVISGAGHGGDSFLAPELREEIVAFFARHLKRP